MSPESTPCMVPGYARTECPKTVHIPFQHTQTLLQRTHEGMGVSHFICRQSSHILVLLFQNSIFFHNSLEELHKHVGPEVLPEEYGGTLGPFSNKDIREAIKKHGNHFKEVQAMVDKSRNKDKI